LLLVVLAQDAGVSDVQERVSLTVAKDGARVLKVRDSAKAKWRPFMQVSSEYTLEVIDLTEDKEALVLFHNINSPPHAVEKNLKSGSERELLAADALKLVEVDGGVALTGAQDGGVMLWRYDRKAKRFIAQ
jgi:hypothetical protein